MAQALKPFYRIHLWCPRCDKTYDHVAPIVPNPRVNCPHCFHEGFKRPQEMKVVAAEQVQS